jgi:hypothetical protein
MYADSFRIYMEQSTLIRFFTLKGLKARAIHTGLESVYGAAALARPAVKKWWKTFHQGRTNLFDDSKSERPLTNHLARVIGSMLEERPISLCKMFCRHFRIGKAICLRILHVKVGLKKFRLG